MDTEKFVVPPQAPPSYNTPDGSSREYATGLIPVEETRAVKVPPHNPAIVDGLEAVVPVTAKGDINYPHHGDNTPASNPLLDAPEKQKKKFLTRKWLIILLVALVVIIVIAIAVPVAIVTRRQDSNSESTATADGSQTSPTDAAKSLGTESVGPTVTPFFTLPLGVNRMTVSNIQTTGDDNLCLYQWRQVPYTYTILPSITGSTSAYTAAWTLARQPAYKSSLTESASAPLTAATAAAWRFEQNVSFQIGGGPMACQMSGKETIQLAEDGKATYISELSVDEPRCKIERVDYKEQNSCTLSWTGEWRN